MPRIVRYLQIVGPCTVAVRIVAEGGSVYVTAATDRCRYRTYEEAREPVRLFECRSGELQSRVPA